MNVFVLLEILLEVESLTTKFAGIYFFLKMLFVVALQAELFLEGLPAGDEVALENFLVFFLLVLEELDLLRARCVLNQHLLNGLVDRERFQLLNLTDLW